MDRNTSIERIRWGKVYGDLPELVAVIANSTSRSPLFLPVAGARLALARGLCALFRTTFPPEAENRLRAPRKGGVTDVVLRISATHRRIAALHTELADLVVTAAGANTRTAQPPAVGTAQKAAEKNPPATVKDQPVAASKAPALTEQQRMHAKLPRSQRQRCCRNQGTGEGVKGGARRASPARRMGNQRVPVRLRVDSAGEAAPRVPSKSSRHAVAKVAFTAGRSRRPAAEGRSLEPSDLRVR